MRLLGKLLVILSAQLAMTLPAKAWNGLRYSLDWGYMASVYQTYRYNYIAEEEFRVKQHGSSFFLNSNGLVKLFVGTTIGRHAELGMFSGYEGIRQDRRAVPLGLRAGWAFRGLNTDGPMCYAEGGAALHKDCATSGLGAAGLGWHCQLDHGCGLDFKVGVNVCGDHPPIKGVSTESLRKSDALYSGISFTVGLCF